MRQRWRDLLFLHFACDPAEIASLLPPGLSVDTFPDDTGEERAWVGLVPFRMTGVRWAFAPPIPGTHTFLETNVRTYVHREGHEPGVWFFSLDAANRLAVAIARAAFSLPYFPARMTFERRGERLDYRGVRGDESYAIRDLVGATKPTPVPGGLDFFLLERYLLYASQGGRLLSGRVHHAPYAIHAVEPQDEAETLVRAAGIEPRAFTHRAFSQGVDVDVFPLRTLG